MKVLKSTVLIFVLCLLCSFQAYAERNVKAMLISESNGEPLAFATVSLTQKGQKKVYKYVLSNDKGGVVFESVRKGTYILKAELMGYVPFVQEVSVVDKTVDLGELKVKEDRELIDAAKVTALGNPVIIKKDTIEYNASSFKTTENDVLEDLLKKLPGVEVSEDGSITVNGQEIKKITIDGKTFFLDDPQLASKNIPAKIVNKLKVIDKKSEQAEFTGIDDGQEETIIDLSIKPGMMNGTFGNVMGGIGHDVPSIKTDLNDYRYQGAAFAGRFTDKTQISVIFNANNTNNRGFNDLSGSMMQGMRGGGGGMGRGQGGWGRGNGITTSYMGGGNVASSLFDDRMNLGGNYLYNYTSKDVEENSVKTTFLDDRNIIYTNNGISNSASGGHRFGIRLDHKFSENTSILFEPRVDFGTGSFYDKTDYTTETERVGSGSRENTNDGNSLNEGANKNFRTSGFLLFRQRLGKPGRTLTLFGRYNISNNQLASHNYSFTRDYGTDSRPAPDAAGKIDQDINSHSRSRGVSGNLTYTEPLADRLFLEGNYSYSWNMQESDKNTFDRLTNAQDFVYSNEIQNISSRHEAGVNLMFQTEKFRLQGGLSISPEHTFNSTTKYDAASGEYKPMTYTNDMVKWSPRMMAYGDFSESFNGRLHYFGRSSQPSTSQLMPVPDVSNPLAISFGNPGLQPYFSHNFGGVLRYSKREKFFSVNARFNGGFTQNPIVSALWYGKNGAQYTMPFNGPASANLNGNVFVNAPIGKSPFSIMNMTRVGWNTSSSYVGTNIDTERFGDPAKDYYKFMEAFLKEYSDIDNSVDFKRNTTKTLGITERIRLTYRSDALELNLGARTRVNRSWYTIVSKGSNNTTWNNRVDASVVWTWESAGLSAKCDGSYNWYNGYSTPQKSEVVFNAELNKTIFKKKVTLSLKGYDILGQARNLMVSDASNYHTETINNTLGRYIVLSATWRFGNFNGDNGGRGGFRGHRPPRH